MRLNTRDFWLDSFFGTFTIPRSQEITSLKLQPCDQSWFHISAQFFFAGSNMTVLGSTIWVLATWQCDDACLRATAAYSDSNVDSKIPYLPIQLHILKISGTKYASYKFFLVCSIFDNWHLGNIVRTLQRGLFNVILAKHQEQGLFGPNLSYDQTGRCTVHTPFIVWFHLRLLLAFLSGLSADLKKNQTHFT